MDVADELGLGLDTGFEVTHDEDGRIVLVDDLPLGPGHLRRSLSPSPGHSHDHGDGTVAPQLLRDVADGVGHVVPSEGGSDDRDLGSRQGDLLDHSANVVAQLGDGLLVLSGDRHDDGEHL